MSDVTLEELERSTAEVESRLVDTPTINCIIHRSGFFRKSCVQFVKSHAEVTWSNQVKNSLKPDTAHTLNKVSLRCDMVEQESLCAVLKFFNFGCNPR